MYSPSRQKTRCTCFTCGDRWCIPCQKERQWKITQALKQLPNLKLMMTLTMKHRHDQLKDQIDRLHVHFATLRRGKWLKDQCQGGIAFLEIKAGRDGLWHPHLHVLLDARYVDRKALSREWLRITGDSSIVDVRAIPEGHVQRYVTKYVTKTVPDSLTDQPEMFVEAVLALKGRRMFAAWGTVKVALKDVKDEAEEDKGENDWQFIGTLEDWWGVHHVHPCAITRWLFQPERPPPCPP